MKTQSWVTIVMIFLALIVGFALGNSQTRIETVTVTEKETLTHTTTIEVTSTTTIYTITPREEAAYKLPTSEYKISYSPIVDSGTAYLKVRVEGEASSLKLMLSDPEGNTNTAHISKDELLDGAEVEELRMADYGKTPKAGTYMLIIKRAYTGDIVYQEELTFNGADVSVENVEFQTKSYEYLDKGAITEISLIISNDGDLPAIINKIAIIIDGDMYEIPFYEGVLPKENKEIIRSAYISLRKGTYLVTIKLYSREVELASYDTRVVIG